VVFLFLFCPIVFWVFTSERFGRLSESQKWLLRFPGVLQGRVKALDSFGRGFNLVSLVFYYRRLGLFPLTTKTLQVSPLRPVFIYTPYPYQPQKNPHRNKTLYYPQPTNQPHHFKKKHLTPNPATLPTIIGPLHPPAKKFPQTGSKNLALKIDSFPSLILFGCVVWAAVAPLCLCISTLQCDTML